MVRTEFRLPDLGEGIAEGELVSWLVGPGDRVSEDQPVAEVETDKALAEVPSPYDGTVAELFAEEGDVVPVGSVLVSFEVDPDQAAYAAGGEPRETGVAAEDAGEASTPGGDSSSGGGEPAQDPDPERGAEATREPEPEAGRVFAPPSVRRLARDLGVDIGTVEGTGPGGRVTGADVRAAASAAAVDEREDGETPADAGEATPMPSADPDDTADAGTGAEPASTGGTVETGDDDGPRDRTLATPATRRVARELGVDIDAVPPAGERDGEPFVTEAAVREYATHATGESAADESGAGQPGRAVPVDEPDAGRQVLPAVRPDEEALEAVESPPEPGERVPYRGVRRTVGRQMVRSATTVPHVTHTDSADATALADLRAELAPAAEEEGVRLTYTPFVLKAVATALAEYPYLNATLDEEAEEIRLHDEYDLGVATATDAGLLVPVVENVDGKGLLAVAREVDDLAGRARDRSITREEMQGSTFTVTNVGAVGGEYATPIVNYPEVGILALGAIRERPRVVDGEVRARLTLPLSLSFDHRVLDGAVAARFTNRVISLLETPSRLLLE